jgi:hypothetical protein
MHVSKVHIVPLILTCYSAVFDVQYEARGPRGCVAGHIYHEVCATVIRVTAPYVEGSRWLELRNPRHPKSFKKIRCIELAADLPVKT